MKCYSCGQLGHLAYRCLEKPSSSNHEKRVVYVEEDNSSCKENEVDHIESKKGESFMFRRVLVKQLAPNEA